MTVADDPRVVAGQPVGEQDGDGARGLGLERGDQRRRDQRVIGGDAGLSGVEQLAGHQPRHGAGEVGGRMQDRRRLAAQFQRDRRQVRRGGGHDLAPDACRAGKDQMIPRQGAEFPRHLDTPGDDGHRAAGKGVGDQRRQRLGRPRREFRGLHHDAVAGRQRIDRRTQRQQHGIIPRSDHADHTQRLIFPERPRRQQKRRAGHPPPPHPAAQIAARMGDLVVQGHQFQQPRLGPRPPAKVAVDGSDQRGLVRADRRGQPRQRLAPVPQVLARSGRGGALTVEQVAQAGHCRPRKWSIE